MQSRAPPHPPPYPLAGMGGRGDQTRMRIGRRGRNGRNLLGQGFSSLLVTQSLGAANDNILKQVLIFMVTEGLWRDALGTGGQSVIALCLTLPFVLLSGYAGQLNDRISKQRVAVWMKIAEIPIVAIAGVGLWMGQLYITLIAFICMSIQSTIFSPAKYGMIPELVKSTELSRANGMINMLTNIAIIVGTMIAGPVSDRFFPTKARPDGAMAEQVHWLPFVVMVAFALAGLVAVLFLPKLKSQNEKLQFDPNPFSTYWRSIREMSRGPILLVAVSWSYFYLIAMMSILLVPEYKGVLNIGFTEASYLLGVLAVAIGVGSALAGLLSGDHIEPRLVPAGAVGLTAFLVLLGTVKPNYQNVAFFLGGAGISAGLYLVPLQALLQELAPDASRGRYLAAANAMSSIFMSVAAGITWLARSPSAMGLSVNRSFLVCAVFAALSAIVMFWRLGSMTRRFRAAGAETVVVEEETDAAG